MATTIYLIRPETYPIATSYLLDTYSAAAAYSLRQLKTGVTNVVRVRRSSDNAESDFTAEEVTDGTLTTWTGANDGFVVTWYDQSGNGNDVTQSTAANQPKIVSSGAVLTKNSLPTVTFDGSNDGLSILSTVVPASGAFSCFTVGYSNTSSTFATAFATGASATTDRVQVVIDRRTSPKRNLFIDTNTGNFGADLSVVRNDANYRLLSGFVDNSKNMSAFDNGATGGTATYTGSYVSTRLTIGNASGGAYLNGGIGEIIIFSSDESANRTAIESDINTYYSIY